MKVVLLDDPHSQLDSFIHLDFLSFLSHSFLSTLITSFPKVVLLDDPLAACDPTVAQRLMQRVIGPRGLLKDKLRVFVSSSLEPLAEADAIHVLAAGGVAESGDRCSARGRARGVLSEFIDMIN